MLAEKILTPLLFLVTELLNRMAVWVDIVEKEGETKKENS